MFRLSCDIQNSQTATKKCPVVLKAAMSYGSEKTILFSIPFESKGLPTGPSHQLTSTESSDGNRTAIIIGCIVGGVIVLTLLGLLLYLQRRKTSYKESPNMRDGSSVGLRLPSQLPVEMVWPRQLSNDKIDANDDRSEEGLTAAFLLEVMSTTTDRMVCLTEMEFSERKMVAKFPTHNFPDSYQKRSGSHMSLFSLHLMISSAKVRTSSVFSYIKN